ncbi:MAG: hypothetical protein N4A68_06895 [Maledivibacter sp.]|jgi:hypothetical protein|nr:hypothetical protein [Maledivibacter sp.]
MKKYIAFILLIVFIFSDFTVYGSEKKVDLEIKDKMKNSLFLITWQNDSEALVELTTPNGETLNAENLKERYKLYEKCIAIFINTPEIGNWKFKISGENLGKVSIEVSEITELIEIEDFNILTEDNRNSYKFEWNIKNTKKEFTISLYADIDNKGYDGTKIISFSGDVSGSKNIKIDNLSYGEYYFYMKAESSNKAVDYMYYDKPLLVNSPNAPEKVENIKMMFDNNQLNIVWDKSKDPNIKSYRIMLFKKENSRPFFFEDINDIGYNYSYYDEEDMEVAVAAISNEGIRGKYDKKSVDIKNYKTLEAKIGFPKVEILNTKKIILPIDFVDDCRASLLVNDIIIMKDISETNTFLVNLVEGVNNVNVILEDDSGNKKYYDKKYFVDTYPPQLNLSKDYDNIQTKSDNIIISGALEPNAKLYINGREIDIPHNRTFDYKMDLLDKENKLNIRAVDLAGNEVIYNGVIYKANGTNYFMIILLGGLLLTLILAFYFIKKQPKIK